MEKLSMVITIMMRRKSRVRLVDATRLFVNIEGTTVTSMDVNDNKSDKVSNLCLLEPLSNAKLIRNRSLITYTKEHQRNPMDNNIDRMKREKRKHHHVRTMNPTMAMGKGRHIMNATKWNREEQDNGHYTYSKQPWAHGSTQYRTNQVTLSDDGYKPTPNGSNAY